MLLIWLCRCSVEAGLTDWSVGFVLIQNMGYHTNALKHFKRKTPLHCPLPPSTLCTALLTHPQTAANNTWSDSCGLSEGHFLDTRLSKRAECGFSMWERQFYRGCRVSWEQWNVVFLGVLWLFRDHCIKGNWACGIK